MYSRPWQVGGPAVAVVIALAVVVAAGLAMTAPPTQASQAATAMLRGEVVARPGQTVMLTNEDVAFADGTTAVTYRIPRHRWTRLRVAVDARVRGRSGYRAVVGFQRGRKVLRLQRIRDGAAVAIGRARIPRHIGRTLRIELHATGDRIRARAWTPGNGVPGWQVDTVDPRPLSGSGRPRARVQLGRQALRPVSLRYWLESRIHSTTSPTPPPTSTPTPTTPPPPSTACPELGVYNHADPDHDSDTVRQFGATPQAANSYYQPTQRINVVKETARIRRGTSPNITITTKGTDTIEALATGSSHPRHAEASAWLSRHIDDLSTLADVDPSVPVYATLEHEFKVKQRLGMVTGPSADPANYGRVLDMFYERAHAENPRLRTTYWIVGSDRQVEGRVAEEFRTLPKAILFDPYADVASETLTSITTADLAWIRDQDWYVGQEIGLGEFGMRVMLGDDALGRFFADVRQQLAQQRIAWAVFFNRERDFDTRIAERTDGKVFPKARTAFGNSLKSTHSC